MADYEQYSNNPSWSMSGAVQRMDRCIRHGRWMPCTHQQATKQWMSGMLTLLLVQLMAILIFAMIISSFFGWNILDFHKRTNKYIWGGLIGSAIFVLGSTIYAKGFTGIGAAHVQRSNQEIANVNMQPRRAAYDPSLARKSALPYHVRAQAMQRERVPHTPTHSSPASPSAGVVPSPGEPVPTSGASTEASDFTAAAGGAAEPASDFTAAAGDPGTSAPPRWASAARCIRMMARTAISAARSR